MYPVIECLPVLSGLVIAFLFKILKPSFLKNISLALLAVLSGIAVNLLSREGAELALVDILLTGTSAGSFILLSRLFIRQRL